MCAPAEIFRAARLVALGRSGERVVAVALDDVEEIARIDLAVSEAPAWIAGTERADGPRWVWSDSRDWASWLLSDGRVVARCHDLRLSHAILAAADGDASPSAWAAMPDEIAIDDGLFPPERVGPRLDGIDETLAEWRRQAESLRASPRAGRLRLLLAAESAGSLVAAEMHDAGLPWDVRRHEGILTAELGERGAGGRPVRLEAVAARVRDALGDPSASLDSHPRLLRALRGAGVFVDSTSKWELSEHDHSAIEPLLEYKRLSRLFSANGWSWLDEWVADGRFRPVYVPGGVVTGRWASSGGGALQLPRQLRPAVHADPGWRIIDADVAQLEPRVLAAMSHDADMARAAAGQDLYEGIVASGAVATRAEAKIAVLGAMYGATTGDSGRLVPRLRRVFPAAMRLVDDAARAGERGGVVATWLGRTSPPPDDAWHEHQSRASTMGASPADEERARRTARDHGRFTRNFIVQGTAAEWALAWMADLRLRLAALPPVPEEQAAPRSGPIFARRAHLAFFLHDELIVHAPASQAEAAAAALRESAAAAGRTLFGDFPIDFPLDLRVADSLAAD
ncbi:bifunctional 3'-5' exonuclease/DNA polymerase [Microbacterium sp. G2-8]|uniref:bifunctional 3'-5' exonuclease/DNA polymerase n=1 Tax=Microbacterium sp. G2-8 TaxID=2842454 RepID=UPI0027E362B0|nr:bifunctional 3'-5' exonuclease/DNA polymerase [Microbacterium sp. G2-8]